MKMHKVVTQPAGKEFLTDSASFLNASLVMFTAKFRVANGLLTLPFIII